MSGSGGGRSDGFGGGSSTTPGGDPRPPGDRPATGGNPVGGGGGGGGGGDDPTNICAVIQRAPLNSVSPPAAPALRVGDELDVILDQSGPRPILAVRNRLGQDVGSLTHRGHAVLIRCIGDGWAYRAVVISVSGGAIELRVQPA